MNTVMSERVKKAGTILSIPVDMIRTNSSHPRKHFDEKKLNELVISIKNNGIIQPLLVRIKDGSFELISGERRLLAAKKLFLSSVPCIIMNVSDEKSLIYSFTDNVQRNGFDFNDEAYIINKLSAFHSANIKSLAEILGKSEYYINSRFLYNSFSDDIKHIIDENQLSDYYITALSKLGTEKDRIKFIKYISENKGEIKITGEEKLSQTKPVIKFSKLYNLNIFTNTFNHTVETMRKAGINATLEQSEQPDCFEYVIRIPKMTSSPVRTVNFSCNAV